MSLTVTRDAVKAKAAIDGSTYDSAIDDLIDEWVPVLEFAIIPAELSDATAGLVSTLDLGAVEVIAGEFIAQLARSPGAYDSIKIGDLEIRPFFRPLASDPSGLKDQGRRRLRPFLKPEAVSALMSTVLTATGKDGVEE